MMQRTVYLNGHYTPECEARVSIFDRGFLMADAVYEVTTVMDGRLVDFHAHMSRLDRSLDALQMNWPLAFQERLEIHRELIVRNQLTLGLVYLQVTRGNPGDRDYLFPDSSTALSVVAFTQSKPDLIDTHKAQTGLKVISVPDQRWGRRDIKTVQLLFASMVKMQALRSAADDAWLVESGYVTEGSSSNAFIICGNRLITRSLGTELLAGVTRASVLQIAEQAGLELVARPFTIDEAKQADEALMTSASIFVLPVVQIDGQQIGTGHPGPYALKMRELYIAQMRQRAVW